MKIKFSEDDNFPLNKVRKFRILTIIVRSAFEENGNYYPPIFFGNCLYEI